MKFGKVDNPQDIDFSIPNDNPENAKLWGGKPADTFNVYVGCAKWNKTDLKNFYPKGTKDELVYYASQFNSIELNATFYRIFPKTAFQNWNKKTPENFRFFPKVSQRISHYKRLQNCDDVVQEYADNVVMLEEKLGCCFLQLHDNFGPTNYDHVANFLSTWPKAIPLALELRHKDWYTAEMETKICNLMQKHNIAHILVDTAGRRDLMHMHFTNSTAFVRYVGANHTSDAERLEKWVERIALWKQQGLQNLYFFVHQNVEEASPLLASRFIENLNKKIGTSLTVPKTLLDAEKTNPSFF